MTEEDGVASIGECMLELSGQAGPNWRMGFAGDTFNTLWALHALSGDRPATYVSAFGDDPFSRDQIGFFAQNGIGIGASPVISGARPGLYAITLTGAERAFTYWRGDAAARQLASDPAALAKSLENQALVYFSGITLAILDEAARNDLAGGGGQGARGRLACRLRSQLPAAAVAQPRGRASRDPRSACRHRHRAADLSRRADAVRRQDAASNRRTAWKAGR